MEPQIEHLTDASDQQPPARPGLGVIVFWATAARVGIRSIPALAALRDGQRVGIQAGVLLALAGTVTLTSAMLSPVVSKWCVLLAALVGLNQWLYVATGSCPASLVLRRSCRLQSVMSVDDDRAEVGVKEVTV